eukprot:CAMPEP_0172673018 /NCGR_PEP_ID=MMETSP1074-20121228/11896_1 /TAXON_ID=2916 /ORGANISM="Ceratium fusus, Strain PA161109" /LENGTH=158 /DNA_ID=CAMNT_0013490275 /DNA_START=243 /DNA_END=716 /DNA_ORIENTATION=-
MKIQQDLQPTFLCPGNSSVDILKRRTLVGFTRCRTENNPIAHRQADCVQAITFDLLEILLGNKRFAVFDQLSYNTFAPQNLHNVPLTSGLLTVLGVAFEQRFSRPWLKQEPATKVHTTPRNIKTSGVKRPLFQTRLSAFNHAHWRLSGQRGQASGLAK